MQIATAAQADQQSTPVACFLGGGNSPRRPCGASPHGFFYGQVSLMRSADFINGEQFVQLRYQFVSFNLNFCSSAAFILSRIHGLFRTT
jgi:hypothetical protein